MAVKILMDPKTGEEYKVEVPDQSGNGDGQHQEQQPQPGNGSQPPFQRSPAAIEKQIQTFLFNEDKPEKLRNRFWALSQKLALTKISDENEYYRFKLRLENVLRVPFLANDMEVDRESLLDMELLDFDSKLDMARSVAFDDHATERELWTIYQQIMKQKIEQNPIQSQSSGSLLGSIAGRILGRGGRR